MAALPTSGSVRHLPRVLVATLAVVGVPILVVSLLHSSGAVVSFALLLVIGMALSLAASRAGAAFWATRPGSGDTVFGDLMLWGWLGRRRQERQLASAVRLLGPEAGAGGSGELGLKRRARLLERLAAALEARDPDTYGHSRRVARHAAATARRMGLSRQQVRRIRTAGAVHDVGKIETPAAIMSKPGGLSDEEFAVIKRHAPVGARMVAGLGDAELTEIVRHHHERLDGGGYPDGLAGEAIPLGARIIAVADTFDAVTSVRPYRPAKRHKEALELLAAEAGGQLDPEAVRAFRRYYSGLGPAALWALALHGPRQLLVALADQLRFGGVAVAAKAAAVTAVAVTAASVVDHSQQGSARPPDGSSPAIVQRPAAPAAQAQLVSDGTGKAPANEGAKGGSQPGGSESGGQEISTPISGTADPASQGSGGTLPDDGGEADEGPGESSGEAVGAGSGSGAPPAKTPVKVPSVPPVSAVTAPVTSTVESVVEAAESTSVHVGVPGVAEVEVQVPNLPDLGLGGK